MADQKIKGWCCTINKRDEDYDFNLVAKDNIKYLVVGKETGESGNKHWQIFVRLNKPQRMSWLKKVFNNNTMHCEPQMGSNDQAAEYCKKENMYYEYGSLVGAEQGARMDLVGFVESLKDESKDFIDLTDEHPKEMVKYYKFGDRYRQEMIKRKAKERHMMPVKVVYIWGKTRCGKTKKAYEMDPKLYRLTQGEGTQTTWFDGYMGEDTLLIDDFRGGIKMSYILQLLDRYYMSPQIKGSFTHKCWLTVIITSNKPPEAQYPGVEDQDARDAWLARLTQVIAM